MNLNEKDIVLMYFTVLYPLSLFKKYTEYPLNGGYADLVLLSNKYNYIFEFKYIKKQDKNNKIIEEKLNDAKGQLDRYSQDERINKNNLKKYIILYVGSNLEKIIEV